MIMNVPMSQIAARGVLNDPIGSKLSPASLAALQAAATNPKSGPTPELANAFAEAKRAGYQPQGFSWKALGEALAVSAVMIAAPYAIGALVGGGAAGAAAGGSAAVSSIPADIAGLSGVAAPTAAAGVGIGAGELGATTGLGTLASTAGTIAGPGAAAITGGGSQFGNALLGLVGGKAGLVNTGLNLAGAALSSSAAKDAAATQAASAQKAIDQLGPMYAPYQQAGQQGLGNLQNFLSGGQQPQQPTPAPLPNGWQPINGYGQQPSQAQGMGNLGNLTQQPLPGGGMTGNAAMVTLKAPDGSTRTVPRASAGSLMQAAQQHGQSLQVVQ